MIVTLWIVFIIMSCYRIFPDWLGYAGRRILCCCFVSCISHSAPLVVKIDFVVVVPFGTLFIRHLADKFASVHFLFSGAPGVDALRQHIWGYAHAIKSLQRLFSVT